MADRIIDVTLVCDTSALADGDVISDTAEIVNALPLTGQAAELVSVEVLDEDDQGVALDLVFLRENVSLGTKNSAPNISDANARNIIGQVNVATSDYVDLGGSRIAVLQDLGLMLSANVGTSVYVSAVSRGGTPTYSASGLKLRLGIRHLD